MNLPALKTAADWCVKHSIIIPDDIVAGLYQHGVDVKTPGYYARVMWEAVRELYAGDITQFEFEDVMIRLIEEQLRKAWNEGMRELDLDPQVDQTEEGEAYLQEIMNGELDYVPQLGQDILDAAKAGESVKGGPGSGNFDHEGRPGEVGGSAPSGGGGAEYAKDVAGEIGFDADRIKIEGDPPSGYSDRLAVYNRDTGEITLYDSNINDLSKDEIRGVLAHEIMHDKINSGRGFVGVLNATEEKFGMYSLKNSGSQVSEYSAYHWELASVESGDWFKEERAYGETLAEMASLDAQGEINGAPEVWVYFYRSFMENNP